MTPGSERAGGTRPRRRRAGPLRWALRGLAALVLLELALQLAAPIYRAVAGRGEGRLAADAPLTVLCVGDSHTFGLNMPQLCSYPERLSVLLGQRFDAPVAVVNRGVPGHNSAQVVAALPDDLQQVRPDVVLILAGINDTWNRDAEGGGSDWLGRLRLVRLARVLLAGVTSPHFEVRSDAQGRIVVDRGHGEQPVNMGAGAIGVRAGDELAAAVQAQLRRALALVREDGARPVLMTYAESAGDFATVNRAVRELAAAEGVLLVDHERDFSAHFAQQGYASLMLNDHHPNARGYALMAEAVDRAMAEAGWLAAAAAPAAGGAEPGDAIVDAALALSLEADGGLLLSGPAGAPFQLLVAGAAGPDGGLPAGERRIPLQDDALLALSRVEPSFSGRLGADGTARVAVPAALRQAGAGREWAACAVLLGERPGDPPITAVSPTVALRF